MILIKILLYRYSNYILNKMHFEEAMMQIKQSIFTTKLKLTIEIQEIDTTNFDSKKHI
jgi:hypothetical protein